MDVSQELHDTENALRDFISAITPGVLGSDWIDKLGVTPERIQGWLARKEVEEKRQEAGVVEERLLYYADFYDLKTILKKHWSHFSVALGDWKTMEVYLTELERLRDSEAHRRELLPHQKHLILGIGGEIRTRLVRYRSKQETPEDYFPRIESVRDSLGNIWTPGPEGVGRAIDTKALLRPGDQLDFVVTATDPQGTAMQYAFVPVTVDYDPIVWQESNTITFNVERKHIGRFMIRVLLRNARDYRAFVDHDDEVAFMYTVLPPKTTVFP
jgi:hypothetical protein